MGPRVKKVGGGVHGRALDQINKVLCFLMKMYNRRMQQTYDKQLPYCKNKIHEIKIPEVSIPHDFKSQMLHSQKRQSNMSTKTKGILFMMSSQMPIVRKRGNRIRSKSALCDARIRPAGACRPQTVL